MGKQKQQVISRFFAPKPLQNPPPATPTRPPPKVSATVSFSPSSKRHRPHNLTLAQSPSPPPHKKLKPTHSTETLTLPPLPSNESLHQKFLDKFLEPEPPPSSPPAYSLIPPSKNPNYTPLEQQVVELKSKYPDVLLMFEVGYRYRFFGVDAETAARVLGIFAHVDHNFLIANIPTFRLNFHVRRLVSAGCKVGVVKQTETAAIKAHGSNRLGPFSRDLSALYTRSTVEAAQDMGGPREEDLGATSSNFMLCIVEKEVLGGHGDCGIAGRFDVKVGMVGVEISTGDVIHGEFNDNVTRSGLEAVVSSLSPTEILLGQPLSAPTEKLLLAYAGPTSDIRVERTSRDCFDDGGALAEVMSLYENIDDDMSIVSPPEQSTDFPQEENHHLGLEGIMAMPGLAVQALALTIRYLKQFGFERIIRLGATFRPFSSNIEMTLSANTLDQLEVLKNSSDGSLEGSLLQAMDHTYTSFGSRLLKHWVSHPLSDRHSILSRLDAVNEITESMGSSRPSLNFIEPDEEVSFGAVVNPDISYLLSSVLKMLGTLPDVQRGITRIFHGTATSNEFISAMHAIVVVGKQLQQLHVEDDGNCQKTHGKSVQSALLKRLILTASSSTVISNAAKLVSSLNKDAADQGDVLNLFNISSGQFPEVARCRTAVQVAKEKLDVFIGQYRKQLGMPSLEFMSVCGTTHLIELPSDRRVPSNWVKISSTKKTNRYRPLEVLIALDELLIAKEELAVASKATWHSFLMSFGKYYAQFQAVVQSLAALDCLHSLAILSRNWNYVRPVFVDDDEPSQLYIQSGRHPVCELTLGDNFVPNDTVLHSNGEYCQIVTGPNMGGKSCYVRQVALIAVMAQVGSFVPATSAKIRVFDGIYTRMGASDSIRKGTSTFFEELSETSHILQHCSSHSLVIIDELGLGTSTHDGVAIAYATLHHLLEQKKCMVLFVTHYPEIMDIQNEFVGSVRTYHVSYLRSQIPLGVADSKSDHSVHNLDPDDVTFLYKVVHGASDKSFGLNVARLAQIPSSCIERATIMAGTLEMELCTRAETRSARKLLTDAAKDYHIDGDIQNHPNSLEIYCRDEELTKGLHKLFFYLKSASTDVNPGNILCSLKNASDLALKMIEGEE